MLRSKPDRLKLLKGIKGDLDRLQVQLMDKSKQTGLM